MWTIFVKLSETLAAALQLERLFHQHISGLVMKLTGNTILITGGSSGIGFELSRQLAALGNTIIITGRNSEKLAAAKQKLPDIHCIKSDVSDQDSISRLHDIIEAEFPLMNVLINNAGIMRKIDVQAPLSAADITQEIDINLCGPVRMVNKFLPQLLSRPNATIVNVSSGLAFVPLPISPIYCATKAAIHSYTQSLRLQLEASGIEVVELAPPLTATSLGTDDFSDEDVAGVSAMSVSVLVKHALSGLKSGKPEIRPGLSNALNIMGRFVPNFAARQMGKSVDLMHRSRLSAAR